MGIAISSVGIKISYAVESTAGTRPTTGYVLIPDLKSIPDMNPQPNTTDSTTFDNTEYTSYIELLKDWGGAIPFDANLTNALYTAWNTLVSAYETGIASSKQTWFAIDIPDFTNAVYFKGKPSTMGIPSASANDLMSTQVFITPDGDLEFSTTKPTYAA